MLTDKVLNQDKLKKDFVLINIFVDCATSLKHFFNYYFAINPKNTFVVHYEEQGNNTKRKETSQCHSRDVFFRFRSKYNKHIKYFSCCPGFVYTFKDNEIENYENYLKHKKFSIYCSGRFGNYNRLYF